MAQSRVPMGITLEDEDSAATPPGTHNLRSQFSSAPANKAPGSSGEMRVAAQFRRRQARQFAMRLRTFVFWLAAQSCIAAHAQQVDGRAIFNVQCVVCHQPDGKGVPGNFPPLARNPDIFLTRDFPARVVLFGMSGKINVLGQAIDGTMPPLGDVLEDEEIAAVVTYVRGAFGNDTLRPKMMEPLDAATIKALRTTKDADQVYVYRKILKTRLTD